MIIKIMPRQSGKTTQLIEEARKTDAPIVVKNYRQKMNLKYIAPDIAVYTIDEFRKREWAVRHPYRHHEVLIDNLDMFLEEAITDYLNMRKGSKVLTATMTTKE